VRQLIGYLRLLHGVFNVSVMVLFIYQGWVGLGIRRERSAGVTTPALIKKHRTAGPVLALFGLFGFISGIVIVLVHFGTLVKYPPHLAAGTALALCIIATFSISRRIRARVPDWRTLHFALGLGILSLYAAQVFLGLGILL
jgi:Na+/H+ antiporter NhaD/arsenite permease-like protein